MSDRGEGLTYREQLPLEVELQQGEPATNQLMQLNAANEMLLRACLAVYDSREQEEHDQVAQELARLDLKLNLLLSTVQQLLRSQRPLPEPVPVTLTPDGLSWPEGTSPALPASLRSRNAAVQTMQVRVEIYISPLMALPLVFYAQLELESLDAGAEWQCRFTSSSPQVSELLEKLIFSFHRRAVALERSVGGPL